MPEALITPHFAPLGDLHCGMPNRRMAALLNVPAFATDDVLTRFKRAYRQGARILVRQSSDRQAHFNLGSGWSQATARDWVRLYGVDPNEIIDCDARGESGREGTDRKKFKALAKDAENNKFGVLVLPIFDRVGRHMAASCGLFDALKKVGGFVLAERRLFDLNNPNDIADLRERANDAERQNEHRRLRHMAERLELAQRLALRNSLPVGLCWAIADHVYRATLVATGRDDLVEIYDDMTRWDVSSETVLGSMRPLWFPDAEVIRACELRLSWLQETGEARSVVDRIRTDPAWPTGRHGLIPYIAHYRWRPGLVVQWLDVKPRLLHEWLGNPSLYGIYAYSTGTKDPARMRRDPATATIFEYDAFPAYASSSDYASAQQILARRVLTRISAPDSEGSPVSEHPAPKDLPIEVDINTATPPSTESSSEGGQVSTSIQRPIRRSTDLKRLFRNVRCGYCLSENTVCAYQLTGMSRSSKDPFRLRSSLCLARGHTSAIDYRMVDRFLLDVVGESLDTGGVGALVNNATLASDAIGRDLDRLRRQEAEAQALIIAAGGSEDAARRRGEDDDVAAAIARQKHHKAELKRIQIEIVRLEGPHAAAAELLNADVTELRNAIRSARRILSHAYEAPELTRRILELCVDVVYVRHIGFGTYEVDADFHSGETVRRTLRLKPTGYPQPLCAFIHASLASGVESASILQIINDCTLRSQSRGQPLRTVALAACAAAYDMWKEAQYESEDGSPVASLLPSETMPPLARQQSHESRMFNVKPRIGPRLSVDHLVAITGADYRELLPCALSGSLGPGISEHGTLWLTPTLGEIHHAGLQYSAHSVEIERGWQRGDAISIQEIGILLPTRSTSLHLPSHALRKVNDPRAKYVAEDASGRIFVRRGSKPAHVLDAFRLAALDSDRATGGNYSELAIKYWRPLDLAAQELRIPEAVLKDFAPSVSFTPSSDCRCHACTVIWLGPEVRRQIAMWQLHDLALKFDLPAEEFHPVLTAQLHFCMHGVPFSARVVNARSRVVPLGRAVSPSDSFLRTYNYIHIPRGVWDSADHATMAAWVRTVYTSVMM